MGVLRELRRRLSHSKDRKEPNESPSLVPPSCSAGAVTLSVKTEDDYHPSQSSPSARKSSRESSRNSLMEWLRDVLPSPRRASSKESRRSDSPSPGGARSGSQVLFSSHPYDRLHNSSRRPHYLLLSSSAALQSPNCSAHASAAIVPVAILEATACCAVGRRCADDCCRDGFGGAPRDDAEEAARAFSTLLRQQVEHAAEHAASLLERDPTVQARLTA